LNQPNGTSIINNENSANDNSVAYEVVDDHEGLIPCATDNTIDNFEIFVTSKIGNEACPSWSCLGTQQSLVLHFVRFLYGLMKLPFYKTSPQATSYYYLLNLPS
jgi:hypothetical protein